MSTYPRSEYEKHFLNEEDASLDPLDQFKQWWSYALTYPVLAQNAFTLATVDEDGLPNARIVLLKDVSEEGFIFFTNYESKKAQELFHCPFASMTFFWPEVERQIRIRGSITKSKRHTSEEYFNTRPRGAQIGAWASPQSQTVKDRDQLTNTFNEIDSQFKNEVIPCPPFWGGYILKPFYYEFWQGRKNRLHDRLCYTFDNGVFTRRRLAP